MLLLMHFDLGQSTFCGRAEETQRPRLIIQFAPFLPLPRSLSPPLFQLICPFSRSARDGRRNDSPRSPRSFHEQVAVKPLEEEGFPEESQSAKAGHPGEGWGPPYGHFGTSIHAQQDGTTVEESFGGTAAALSPAHSRSDNILLSILSSSSPISPLFSMWANWRVGGCAQADFLRLLQSQKWSQ